MTPEAATTILAGCLAFMGAFWVVIGLYPTRRLTRPAYFWWGGPRLLPRVLNVCAGLIAIAVAVTIATGIWR